ncbi:AMP-binding protein [bacterium]|nr:AMP-binding protein [bacterium]
MGAESALSYECGTGDVRLIGETIGDLFDRIASADPGREALIVSHQGIRWTYRELAERVGVFARGLMALGVERGDRVGIWSPNWAEWVVTQFATAKIGAVLVNVNPAYRTHELEYALRQSACSVLIIAPPFKSSDYAGLLGQVVPEMAWSRPGNIHSETVPALHTVVTFGDQEVVGALTWPQVLDLAAGVSSEQLAARQESLQFDDPINIQYTSGTTGFPKGATLSHHSILNNGFLTGEREVLTADDRICIPVPFYHCFGMVLGNLAAVTHGATMVVPSQVFDPLETLETVAAERCTALYGVPTMFIAELGHERFTEFDLSSLRTGIMAGAPCPVEVMKQVQDEMHMREVTIAYGMTETSPVSFQTTIDDPLEKQVETVGRVHPHVECKIVDPETGRTVPRGETGELFTRGYLVMLGYWENPEATDLAIDAARWMHSGDLAAMDDEGYVRIVGRVKDMIIRGGENVYPREIEEFLYTHPKVSDVQVIGVPDDKYGEEIMAWVILKPGETADADEMREFCSGRITHFKIPRYWKFVDDFPMTVTGKVQKSLMREQAVAELGG